MEESLKFMGNSFNMSRLLEHDIVPPKTNVFARGSHPPSF